MGVLLLLVVVITAVVSLYLFGAALVVSGVRVLAQSIRDNHIDHP